MICYEPGERSYKVIISTGNMKAREHVKHRSDSKTERRRDQTARLKAEHLFNADLSWNVNQAANELLHQMISRLK